MTDLITLDITDLTPSGDAIGRHEGMVVFVPLVLPGERVEVEIVHRRKNWMRGRAVRVLTPRPDRAEPPCQYFGRCGGCHLQHLTYPAQLALKTAFVREQFVNIGKFTDAPVRDCMACPSPLGYRNHVQFSLTPDGLPGFHPPRQHGVMEIEQCLIAEPYINDEVRRLRGSDDLPESHSVDLRVPMNPIRVGGRSYHVARLSFFQVNTVMAGMLVEHAIRELGLRPNEDALDLYCGVGLFTLPMAERANSVVGIEFGESATRDARRNLRRFLEDERVRIITADVAKALERPELRHHKWHAVLADPPRAGMQESVLRRLIALAPERLVYVSCDPATLARDARMLCDAGYRLESVQPFDMFPQTNHVESIAKFVRGG